MSLETLRSDFPPGVWAKRVPRQVGSGSGASSQATKKDMSNILGSLDLIYEMVDVVEDEVLQGMIANVIALAINHIKDGEKYYTQEELVSALKAQVSALQDGVVGTTLQMCQCEAHQTILDVVPYLHRTRKWSLLSKYWKAVLQTVKQKMIWWTLVDHSKAVSGYRFVSMNQLADLRILLRCPECSCDALTLQENHDRRKELA